MKSARWCAGIAVAVALGLSRAIHAEVSVDEILSEMGFSAAEKQRVLKGEFVTSNVGSVSERDLSFAVAFLVKASPEAIRKHALEGALFLEDAQVQAYGKLSAPGSLADFSGLHLTDAEARALTSSTPGDATNIGVEERSAFRALRDRPAKAVEEQLHRMLLARYQAYRASGLGGIAAYERAGGGSGDVASDLAKASRSASGAQKHMPALYAFLVDYPRGTLLEMQETYLWVKSVIREKPTYVLAHIFSAADGEARAVVRREFYVSTGYNTEQSIAGFLPVTGGTIVICLSHAFTDQVAGSGGSMKRSIGSRVMAGQMKEIFDRARKKVDH
jgi:hypothetical protein